MNDKDGDAGSSYFLVVLPSRACTPPLLMQAQQWGPLRPRGDAEAHPYVSAQLIKFHVAATCF